jgi:hypothetical protein
MLDGSGWSTPPPGRSTRYTLCGRLGGPQRRSGQVRKISPPPGFDPRAVQPVAGRNTDYASYRLGIQKLIIFMTYKEVYLAEGCKEYPRNAIVMTSTQCYPEESAANTGRHKTWTLIRCFPLVHSKVP